MTVTVVTGSYPTAAPTDAGLVGKVAQADATDCDADVKVVASAGAGTLTLLAWDGEDWCPIGDVSLDSSAYGGVSFSRFTPGKFSRFCLWQKSSGATVTRASITTGRLR